MAKTSGLGANLYVGGVDLSGDIGAIGTISGGHAIQVVRGANQSAADRIALRRDGEISYTAFFNAAAGASHLTLSAVPRTDVHVQVLPVGGATAGLVAAAMVAKQASYDPAPGADGSLVASVQGLANAQGLEWGVLLTTGKQTLTAAGAGSNVDDLPGGTTTSAFGLAAYLQVFELTGTSATVTIQHGTATNNYAAIGSGLAFAAATAATTERIVTASATETINRYLRVSVAGTFSSFIFSVVAVRYRALVS
jgi:hypothetical protein